jgi:hypothetical protein
LKAHFEKRRGEALARLRRDSGSREPYSDDPNDRDGRGGTR